MIMTVKQPKTDWLHNLTFKNYYPGQKKTHRGDGACDIEESAVWFFCDASMREVVTVASRIHSRLCSGIKHRDSSISPDSDFMHQHGSFIFGQGSTRSFYRIRDMLQILSSFFPKTVLISKNELILKLKMKIWK